MRVYRTVTYTTREAIWRVGDSEVIVDLGTDRMSVYRQGDPTPTYTLEQARMRQIDQVLSALEEAESRRAQRRLSSAAMAG